MPGEVDYPTETTRTSQPAGGSKRRGVAGRLQRNLGRLDIIFLTIAATISIDTIGQIVSGRGGTGLFSSIWPASWPVSSDVARIVRSVNVSDPD
jgi:hypothetical protein